MWVESWGWGTFGALLGFTPFGVRTPHLTQASYSAADAEKKWFCLGGIGPHLGEIGPHLGEIWGFENCDFGVLWPTFGRNSVDRFSIF